MDGFFQAAGAVLIAVILHHGVSDHSKAFANLLSMGCCAMVLLLALRYLQPVAAFLEELASVGNLSGELTAILLKTSLVGVLTEVTALICTDSGNGSLAQTLRLVGTAVMLWLSLPVFKALLDLIRKILEGL